MPQVQVVDTTENPPEPTGVQEFFSKLGKSYKDQSDRVEIGKLIDALTSARLNLFFCHFQRQFPRELMNIVVAGLHGYVQHNVKTFCDGFHGG